MDREDKKYIDMGILGFEEERLHEGKADYDYGTSPVNNDDIFDMHTTGMMGMYNDILNGEDLDYYKKRKNTIGEIQYMSPNEYYEICAKKVFNSTVNKLKSQRENDGIEELTTVITQDKKKFPITMIDLRKEHLGQEGLHRMMIAGNLFGWDHKFPVLVIKDFVEDTNIKDSYELTFIIRDTFEDLVSGTYRDYSHFMEDFEEELNDRVKATNKFPNARVSVNFPIQGLVAKVNDVSVTFPKNRIPLGEAFKIIGYEPKEPEKIYKNEVKVEKFYDRSLKLWTLFLVDKNGNQISNTEYALNKQECQEVEKDLLANIKLFMNDPERLVEGVSKSINSIILENMKF